MEVRRFFVDNVISHKFLVLEDRSFIRRLKKVLRLKEENRVKLFDKTGNEYICKIKEYKGSSIKFEVLEKLRTGKKPEKRVFLYQALIKKDKFEKVVEKGTEIGIENFTPIITERVIKKALNFERLRKIAIEATEQSGRLFVPLINKPMRFEKALKEARGMILFTHFSGKKIREYLSELKEASEISVFVGPEGDFTTKEVELARSLEKVRVVNLGETILKSETVSIFVGGFIFNL